MVALSPPCAITQATARQHWNFVTAPFLRGHVIRDEEPAPASPAHISILAALIQELNEVRQILAFAENFAIKRGALFLGLIGYSFISRQDTYLIVIDIQFSAETGLILLSKDRNKSSSKMRMQGIDKYNRLLWTSLIF